MIAFDSHEKRSIALRLIASGAWNSSRWSSLSHIVHNDSVGLLPDGTLVTRERPRRRVHELLSLMEAAGVAGVHPATIRRWLKSGKLCAQPDGCALSIRRDDLESFLRAHRAE